MKRIIGNIAFWLAWPGIFIVLHGSHRTRVIISVGDEILFVNNWLAENRLSLPGGGQKRGETLRQAAAREVYEETGIMLNLADLKAVTENLDISENGIAYRVDCYSLMMTEKKTTKPKDRSVLNNQWINWREKIDTKQLSKTTNQLLHAWLTTQHLVD